MNDKMSDREQAWPALPFAEWKDTCATLHMWTQIVGKVRLAKSPLINHWWEVPLYVSARGLTTSSIPCLGGNFEISFDFIDHRLDIRTSGGASRTIALYHRTVAGFYREFMEMLRSLGLEVRIWPVPVEIPNPIRFDQDVTHGRYEPGYANRFWRILVTVDSIFKEFRGRFIGKASPVHFSGVVSTWRRLVFRGGARPSAPERTKSQKKPTRMKFRALDGGRAEARRRALCFILIARQSPQGFARASRVRQRRSSTQNSGSSCFPTTTYARPAIPGRHCWIFAKVPTKPQP